MQRLFTAIGIVFVVGWFFYLRPVELGGLASYILVDGRSMEPTLYTGDLAVVLRQDGYQAGDIVAYRTSGGNVIHRIVGGSAESGFTMLGDNKHDTDPWQPRPDEILGKMWFHLPGGGRVLEFFKQPRGLSLLAGGLLLSFFFGGREVKRRRRRDGHMAHQRHGSSNGGSLGPAWALAGLGACALLALALGAVAVVAFRTPAERPRTVERLRYTHSAAFDYTVHMQPSTLYPDGLVGPIQPPPPGITTTATAPIYTKLARDLDLGMSYSLQSSLPPDVSGELSAVLEIKAGNGWTKTLSLLPATPFAGSAASTRVRVDFDQVLELIGIIEKETGYSPGNYDVSVLPTLHLRGKLGPEPIDEVYAPAFALKVNKTQIVPDPRLSRSEPHVRSDTITREQELGVGPAVLPVRTLRALGAGGAALALAGAGVLAAIVFLGLGRGEAARVQSRYGVTLVSVAEVEPAPGTRAIRVGAMSDLARLAQRDGRIIFQQPVAGGPPVYFVPDGPVTYWYASVAPKQEG